MKRLAAALVFVGLALALSQCSSSSSGAKTLREPLVHFATANSCVTSDASALGPDCSDASQPGCACDPQAANPCTAGPGGICTYHGLGTGWWCKYDLCVTSNDCAAGSTCLCSGARPAYVANLCVPSNCRIDADCGTHGYCSPTAEQPTGYCGGLGATYAGAYCHTVNDDCTDDSDCASASTYLHGPLCAYDLEQGKWTCQDFVCAPG